MTTYAIADQVPEGCDYLTAGKEYEVKQSKYVENIFWLLVDDEGDSFPCDWEGCCHLHGGNWRRVEK